MADRGKAPKVGTMIVKKRDDDFKPVPTGLQPAVCVNVFDIGYQPGYQGGAPSPKVVILWELTGNDRRDDGKWFQLTKLYTASLGEKATLRKDLETWRGRTFTAAELDGFELDKLNGIGCQLLNVESTTKTFVNIAAVMPPRAGPKPTIETPADYIPEWVKKKIAEQLHPEPADDFHDDIPGDDIIPFDQGLPVFNLRGAPNDYAAAKEGRLIPDEPQGITGDDRSAEAHFRAIRG